MPAELDPGSERERRAQVASGAAVQALTSLIFCANLNRAVMRKVPCRASSARGQTPAWPGRSIRDKGAAMLAGIGCQCILGQFTAFDLVAQPGKSVSRQGDRIATGPPGASQICW